ncbi:MAG: cytochrome b/b6 domain-containing protein [Betaproteobacteria bacterium]|nr:cytochrome b/b6 domain-containing protein [Betaproteobacteria bacterium]
MQPGETKTFGSEPGAGRLMVDAPIRMFHILFAVCFFGAWLTSESEVWRNLHVTIGYTMAGLLLFRVGYGLFGPPQARLRSQFERFRGLATMLGFTRTGEQRSDGNAGQVPLLATLQNASMAATILALIVLTAVSAASGYLAWNDAPEWVAELHEGSGEALINLGIIHIALLLCFSFLRRRNFAMTMLTGKITGSGPSIVQHNRTWLALVLFIAVCAFSAYNLRQTPERLFTDHASAQTFKKGGEYKYVVWKERHDMRKHDKHYPKRKHE